MKIINKICILLAVAVSVAGCFSDKGNYEYRDINEVVIDVKDKTSVDGVAGELIELDPEIKFANGVGDKERLQYKWTVDGVTRPDWTTLKFSAVFDEVHNMSQLKLEVFDPVTGLFYLAGYSLTIRSRYNQDGLQILAQKDGKTQFSYLRFTKKEWSNDNVFAHIKQVDVFADVYGEENGEDLPAGPIKIVEHFCSDDTTIGQMLVLTKGGAFDASGTDYKKEVTLGQMFENQAYPAGFGYPSDAFGMCRVDLVSDAEGHIYSRIKHTRALFHSGEYLDQRLEVEGEQVKGCSFVPAPFADFKSCMVYDSNKKRMFLIHDTGTAGEGPLATVNAGHPYLLMEPNGTPEGFVPINDMSGINPIWMGYYRLGADCNPIGYSIVFERDGKTFLQQFTVAKDSKQCVYTVASPTINEITGLPGTPAYAYCIPYANNKTLLLAVGNELWIYDFGNPTTPATKYGVAFSSPVVAMDAENYYSRWLGIALEDGTVYVVNAAKMSNPVNQIVYYKSEESFGKVSHVCFKRLRGNGWAFGAGE